MPLDHNESHYASASQEWPEAWCFLPGQLSVIPSVTKLVNTIFWKRMNWLCSKWHNWSTRPKHEPFNLRVRTSKIKITWRLGQIWKPGTDIIFDPVGSRFISVGLFLKSQWLILHITQLDEWSFNDDIQQWQWQRIQNVFIQTSTDKVNKAWLR